MREMAVDERRCCFTRRRHTCTLAQIGSTHSSFPRVNCTLYLSLGLCTKWVNSMHLCTVFNEYIILSCLLIQGLEGVLFVFVKGVFMFVSVPCSEIVNFISSHLIPFHVTKESFKDFHWELHPENSSRNHSSLT